MKKFLAILLLIIGGIFAVLPVVYAQPSLGSDASNLENLLSEKLKKKLKNATYFVLGIQERIKESGQELVLLNDNIAAIEKKIEENNKNAADLNAQIDTLDLLQQANAKKMRVIELKIISTKNTIDRLEHEVFAKQDAVKHSQAKLRDSLRRYYIFASALQTNGEPNLLAYLSLGNSTGQVSQLEAYMQFITHQDAASIEAVRSYEAQVQKRTADLEEKRKELKKLALLLDQEQRGVSLTKEAQERLLRESQGKQAIYETLLEISRKEHESVSLQILRLKENYDFIQGRLEDLSDPAALDESLEEFETQAALLKGKTRLAWPVSPAAGITAYFHDGPYERAFGVRHNAIDIRLPQGSRVRAASAGVVSKAADNGTGYSYVILSHPEKIMTLYGHLSDILVNEGEVVRQGQTIGLSGGIPGTKGSGWLTTGAHLHFEVFDNFKHVDPLYYLPIEVLPISSVPEEHLERLLNEKVKR